MQSSWPATKAPCTNRDDQAPVAMKSKDSSVPNDEGVNAEVSEAATTFESGAIE